MAVDPLLHQGQCQSVHESKLLRTQRTRLYRKPDRGRYDRQAVNAILDEAFMCHLAFVREDQPYAIPTMYGRDGDRLLVHGSHASRMLRTLAKGIPVCFTATLIDGLVLACSARMHSVNYRSVMILGIAKEIEGASAKASALECIMDHIMPGRWQEVLPPTETDLRETSILEIPIAEGSAKMRTGPPLPSVRDSAARVWSGEVPLKITALNPISEEEGIPIPPYLSDYLRKRAIS
jgi:nitroimidazol reductase NimA-like FMN-containing flavoprotein (pyridoxamine 5'-phosphate oxidase superfamily)